jgi:hypothetical protein
MIGKPVYKVEGRGFTPEATLFKEKGWIANGLVKKSAC